MRDFIDVVFDQPLGHATAIDRRVADLLTLELEVAVDFDVGHRPGRHHGQSFGQSGTLRIKQVLGLAGSMANLDLAARRNQQRPKPKEADHVDRI